MRAGAAGIAAVIDTERLRLRPMQDGDAPGFAAALGDIGVARWLSSPPFPYGLSDAEWFVLNARGRHWTITRRPDDTPVGLISLEDDLGYWLRADLHSQGIMTEAARAVIDAHFTVTAGTIVSGHFEDNVASRRVLTRLGFVDTHDEQVFAPVLGRDVTVRRMVLSAADWRRASDG